MTHPFEARGLGTAPFRCVAVTDRGLGNLTCCNYCGTGIRYTFHIHSTNAKDFVVGSECVHKTQAAVSGFDTFRLKLARDKRAARKAKKNAEFQAKRANETASRRAAFVAQFPDLAARLEASTATYGFEFSMKDAFARWGNLTENQRLALERMYQRDAQRVADRAKDVATSQFFGEVGKRIHGSFTILAQKSWAANFNGHSRMQYWHLLKFGDNICSYKGVCLGQKGETIEATFTVKEHEEYQNVKQTKLSRPFFDPTSDQPAGASPDASDADSSHWGSNAQGDAPRF